MPSAIIGALRVALAIDAGAFSKGTQQAVPENGWCWIWARVIAMAFGALLARVLT